MPPMQHEVPKYASLTALEPSQQLQRGYGHTLAEIWQQPETWQNTAADEQLRSVIGQAISSSGILNSRHGGVVLTGSGSSQFVGDCLALSLQASLGRPVWSIPSGLLLTHPDAALPPAEATDRLLFVSIARSGNSPESLAVQRLAMRHRPSAHHLVITCNREGKLATELAEHPQVDVALLDARTNDRSLVMTSSFTNLLLAGSMLAASHDAQPWKRRLEKAATLCRQLLQSVSDAVADVAALPFKSAIYLGSGSLGGAAREAALKMLEMTAGRVFSMDESFLGFRHGPMSATSRETLVVAMLSNDATVRAFELDLLAELEQKQLGMHTLIAGFDVPAVCQRRAQTTTVEFNDQHSEGHNGPLQLGDCETAALHVVVGQLLGLFRCLKEGLKPDSPSSSSVITRVVPPFRIHGLDD